MSLEPIQAFARALLAEADEATTTDQPYTEEAFTDLVLARLADTGVFENPETLFQEGTFGTAKYKITGYSFLEDEERVTLFTTVFNGEHPIQEVSGTILKQAADRALRFFTCSKKGLHERIEPSNTDASDLARRIFESQERISFLRVAVLTDGLVGARHLGGVDIDDTTVSFDVVGMERLYRILGQGHTRDDIVVDLEGLTGAPLPCLSVPVADGSYRTFLAVLPGVALARTYDQYGTRLLELNVRAFLGVRGRKSVNAGLRATLKDEPQRFLAYNNGIVATVDQVDTVDAGNGTTAIRRLRGFQIVNGGQTTASVFRARRIDRLDLTGVQVPAKIILVRNDDLSHMVSSISKAANRQNTVQPADFSANDPFHVAVEGLANNTWIASGTGRWFYERARGSYGAAELRASFAAQERRRFKSDTPKERRFAKTDLSKHLAAWDGYPHQVSFGAQKNFQNFMQRLSESHPEGFVPDEAWYRRFIALTILFRSVQRLARQRKFPAYQANIVAYTVASLGWRTGCRIDFDTIWREQKLSEDLVNMLDAWTVEVDGLLRSTAGARMPTEWAKKPECWEAIRAAAPALPPVLPPELTAQIVAAGRSGGESTVVRTAGLTAADMSLIDQVREIDSTAWLKIAEWGRRTKAMHYKLAGIAGTMAEYAVGGWSRSPSVKQAKGAMKAMELARSAGIFEAN